MPGTVLPPMVPRGECDQVLIMRSPWARCPSRAQQCVGDRHRHGGADQGDARDAGRVARRAFQRGERTHAVADQRDAFRRIASADFLQQQFDPVGQVLDRGQRRAGAAAVAGQVDGQHAEAVMGEPAALQPQTLWSFCAPWMKTTQGRAASKGLPPV
jgi:hypothetical protein